MGTRTWMIELPPGLKTLNPNERLHWAEVSRRRAELKKAAWAMTLRARVPRLEHADITVEYRPPDRRRRDHDNIPAATGKPCIDGIVAAKVLPDDSPEYVTSHHRIGEPVKGGQVVLHIAEVTREAP